MATSGENKTAGATVESTTTKSDSTSNQQAFFAKWLAKRDNAILPPKELAGKSPYMCHRFEEHDRHGLINFRTSLGSSTDLAEHCPYHHGNRLSNHSFEGQNRTRSAMDKQQTNKKREQNASAHSTFGIDSISSGEQHTSPEKLSKISLRSFTNTKSDGTKPKIFIRTPETCHPLLPKTNATVENFLPVTNEQGIHESSDNDVNHDDSHQLLVVSNLNNCNKDDLVPEQETKTEVTCTETLQLDTVAAGGEKEIETPASANSHYCDLPLWNKQDDNGDQFSLKIGTTLFPFDNEGFQELINEDDSNDDNFEALMKKQNELKAYYDSFPNIDDATNETSPDIKKAKEFTESILRNLPSGDVDDRNTVCHVLNKLLGNGSQECLFYDSEKGINLHDASVNLADMNSEDRPFVLILKSSEGLGGIPGMKTENDDLQLVQILINAIEQNQSHPVIEDITERLSKAYNVDKKSIVIKTVFVGTFNIVYTVLDLAIDVIKSLIEISKQLKKQFKHFINAKIHPLLFRPSFHIAYFDERGNKTFTDEKKTYQVGPPGRTHLYTPAIGWTRYGLKVLGKYTDDNWLHPFQDSGNWYRAFHGTGNAQNQDFGDKKQLRDNQYASVDALSSIFETGFRPARITAYGPGVYCSPDPKFPEQKYVRPVPLDTQKGKKTFKCMLQVAVNPDGVTKHNDIWLVPSPKDIRPYGILVKEA